MGLKDYYKTLDIQPTASLQQVKKSFRLLAHRYHPDKNEGNALAEASFREIQEAYEVLSNPQKREDYNYKRWYTRVVKANYTQELLSPASIVQACSQLNDYLKSVNASRVDFDGLSGHIRRLLAAKNVDILVQLGDSASHAAVVRKIIHASEILPFPYIEPIAAPLLRIADGNAGLANEVRAFVREHAIRHSWRRYTAPAIILFTLLLCWLIYLVSR